MYNILNLTTDQIQKYDEIINRNNTKYTTLFEELKSESYKLCALKKTKAPYKFIKYQRKIVSHLQKELNILLKKEQNEMKQYLNKNQKQRYSITTKLEKTYFKQELCPKNYHKHNPQMEYFGNIN